MCPQHLRPPAGAAARRRGERGGGGVGAVSLRPVRRVRVVHRGHWPPRLAGCQGSSRLRLLGFGHNEAAWASLARGRGISGLPTTPPASHGMPTVWHSATSFFGEHISITSPLKRYLTRDSPPKSAPVGEESHCSPSATRTPSLMSRCQCPIGHDRSFCWTRMMSRIAESKQLQKFSLGLVVPGPDFGRVWHCKTLLGPEVPVPGPGPACQ
jgi:hypothetical protein